MMTVVHTIKNLETIKNEICAVRKVFWYIVTIWCLVTNCKIVCILSSLHFCEFLKWVNIPQTVKSTNVWRVELRGGHKTGTAGCLLGEARWVLWVQLGAESFDLPCF